MIITYFYTYACECVHVTCIIVYLNINESYIDA